MKGGPDMNQHAKESGSEGDEGILEELDIEAHSETGTRAPRARRYTVRIDRERRRVSTPTPTCELLLELVEKCGESHILEQRLRGGGVREIGPTEIVDLRAPGVERFVTYFRLFVEGNVYRWAEDTITTEQIAELGGWNVSEGVVQVDANQSEIQLNPGQVVKLEPGCTFGKPLRWKRG